MTFKRELEQGAAQAEADSRHRNRLTLSGLWPMEELSFKKKGTTTGTVCHLDVLNFSLEVFSQTSEMKKK